MGNKLKVLSVTAACLSAAFLFFTFTGCEQLTDPNTIPTPLPTTQPPPSNSNDQSAPFITAGPTSNQPATNEPSEFQGVTIRSSAGAHTDSAHFRIYATGRNAEIALAHMEAAYKCFITDWGFRSTGLSTKDTSDRGPYYKMNIYPNPLMAAGGYMRYDYNKGLAYLEVLSSYMTDPKVIVHEYGHGVTMHEYQWVDQTRTGAWWETAANWTADTYLNSEYYDDVKQQYGLRDGGTLIDLDRNINMSYLTIVHDQNYYQAWPFFTYLTNNPDNYPGLGKMAIPNLYRNHRRNNETPLHVLERVASPVSVQTILGRYWARMAYLDIGHERAQKTFFSTRGRLNFANVDSIGNQTYRVKTNRRPMYGGANIIPLKTNGSGTISVEVTALNNIGFTATLAIRSNTGAMRYVELQNGSGSATVASNQEASLVVVNTPDSLIQYDAFKSGSNSPECIGLNYQFQISGATPTN